MQKSDFIWFNGEFVAWDDAQIHVLSHVIHYGTGCFEGLRAYAHPGGPAIVGLEAHVRRLFISAKVIELGIEFSPEEVTAAIIEIIKRNGHDQCYVRPLAFRGYGQLGLRPSGCPNELIIATFPFAPLFGEEGLKHGIDVGVSSWRRMAPDTHPAMAKATGNYLNSQMVALEAIRHGYDEGVVLDTQGFVSEGSGENIFVVYQGRILTPAVGSSILPGITRDYTMQLARDLGMDVVEQQVSREMLYYAEEVFMTGTAAEITPVKSVDRRPVGDGKRGELTERLQSEYFGIIKGELPDRFGWLTHVR
jgi:branched-chain amino acid aminotransferase